MALHRDWAASSELLENIDFRGAASHAIMARRAVGTGHTEGRVSC